MPTSTLTGRVIRKQSFGDWAVGIVRTHGGEERKVVGAAVASVENDRDYAFTGEFKAHPRYGEQLLVTIAVPHIEASREALLKHLERCFNGVGPATAEHIVGWHEQHATLEDLRQKLVFRPWTLQTFTTAGSRRGIEFKHQAGTRFNYLYTLLATRHCTSGVPDSVLRRVAKWLVQKVGEEAPDPVEAGLSRFSADPYEPILEVWGYGFAHADSIGAQLGVAKESPCRLAALLYHTLRTASESEGHTFLPLPVLAQRVHRIDPRVEVRHAVTSAMERGYPVLLDDHGRCYPDGLDAVECAAAAMLRGLLQPAPPMRGFANDELLVQELRNAERAVRPGFELDASQRRAVMGLLLSNVRLHTLTAGPGCGKTSIMELFAQLATGVVRFCAPTGKAAKVLQARVSPHGFEATTIHQILEPSPTGFDRNAGNPIAADVVVVDEASMVDLRLIYHLLLALAPTAHLVLVGDEEQLPSVGPGNVLVDLLSLHADHHTLSVTHRNHGAILALVQEVREGVFASPGADRSDDILHLPISESHPGCFELIDDTYVDAVNRVGIQSAVLLVPHRKGRRDTPGWNTTYLNARLQAVLNPSGEPIRGTDFRVGDRVVVRKNMPLPHGDTVMTVVNGDTGLIVSQQADAKRMPQQCVIQLDDGRRVTLAADLLDLVELAYAMTVHAAQGSEYRRAIVLMSGGSPGFLHRRVLYTGLSRPKEHLTLFGETAVLAAVAKRRGASRYSMLAKRVAQEPYAC